MKTSRYDILAYAIPVIFMLISWAVGSYYNSIVLSPIVIYWDQYYYWVPSFWGLLGSTLVFSLFTVLLLPVYFLLKKWLRSNRFPFWAVTNGVALTVWIVIIVYQTNYFNLNEGICH